MSGEVMSRKRAARIERRKSRVAAIFKVDEKPEVIVRHTDIVLQVCFIVIVVGFQEITSAQKEEQGDEPPEKQLQLSQLSDEEYKALRTKLRERNRLTQVIIYFLFKVSFLSQNFYQIQFS